MFERLPDWEQRLHDYVASLHGSSFRWGRLDCALFAAGAVLAMTGDDPAASFRGRYSTSRGSVRALRRLGAGTLEATIDSMFGRIQIGFARRGDAVRVDGMVGICVGGHALFVGDVDSTPGWVAIERSAWSTAWAVG